jgi:hypothetical protein
LPCGEFGGPAVAQKYDKAEVLGVVEDLIRVKDTTIEAAGVRRMFVGSDFSQSVAQL